MNLIKTLLAFSLMLSFCAVAEEEPNEFGYYIKKSDIRAVSRQITELRNCSHPDCRWVKLKNKSDIWAIQGSKVPFAEYLEAYLKSPADSEHFFFINKNTSELLYTTLYGHSSELLEPNSESASESTSEPTPESTQGAL